MPTINTTIERKVVHRFQVIADDGTVYSDALNFTQDEYDALDEKALAALEDVKAQRFADWQVHVAVESAKVQSKEELIAEKADLLSRAVELDTVIAGALPTEVLMQAFPRG